MHPYPDVSLRAEGTSTDLDHLLIEARDYWPLCFIDGNAGPTRLITIGNPLKVVGYAWVVYRRGDQVWKFQIFEEAREL